MSDMSEDTSATNPSDEAQGNHAPAHSVVPTQQLLSPQDKYVLYAVLQDIAQELRRIKREKHQKTQPD